MNMRIKTLVSMMDRHIEALHSQLAEELGIPSSGLEVLENLMEQDGQPASVLARSVGRAATSFTPILDKIQDKGLILRRPDPEDRRVVRIYITANGEAAAKKAKQQMDAIERPILVELVQRGRNLPQGDPANIIRTFLAPLPNPDNAPAN